MAKTLPYSTMQTDHNCGHIYDVGKVEHLCVALKVARNPIIVGGGSNIVFTKDTERDLIVVNIKGIEVVGESEDEVYVTVGAGENWHDLVLWAIENDFGGIENLSLIPGKCGAAPIQNIGAYGTEIKDVLEFVEAVDRSDLSTSWLQHDECEFGYRDSIFKHALKDKVVISAIGLRLTKPGHHKIDLSYSGIKDDLSARKIKKPTIKDVSDVVIDIRRSKLPDPAEIPNCGSFFKNPIITRAKYMRASSLNQGMPSYPVDGGHVKIPAGWLIDKAGLKGYKKGKVGTHISQALVIVNHGTLDGKEIIKFADHIADKVKEKYGIALEREVNAY